MFNIDPASQQQMTPAVTGASGFRQTTGESFKQFVGQSFNEEQASNLDKFIYDVFLQIEEHDGNFEELDELLEKATPSLKKELLLAAKEFAKDEALTYVNNALNGATGTGKLENVSATDQGLMEPVLEELYADEGIEEEPSFFLKAMQIFALGLLATGVVVTTYKAYDAIAGLKADAAPVAPPPRNNSLATEFQEACPAIDLDTLHLQEVVDICQEPSLGPTYCAGHQGVPRIEMPQVSSEALNGYIETLQANNGTAIEHITVPSSSIVPFQSEQRMDKTLGMAKSGLAGTFDVCGREIIVAGLDDGSGKPTLTIVDGHHGGTACKILGGQQKVVWIKADPATVIADLNSRPDVWHAPL